MIPPILDPGRLAPRKRPGAYTPAEVKAMLAKPRGRVRNVAPRADRTYNGVVYDSKVEALHAFKLDGLKASGKILGWRRQDRVPLRVYDTLVCTMVIDFRIINREGPDHWEEIKGWETPEYKIKLKLFKALYPKADYRVVKV